MKSAIVGLIFFCIFQTTDCLSQQQWKFHIAFEDAVGAKDTIWLIWDTTAHFTLPVDFALGEGAVQLDYSTFNVFTGNANGDTTKTVALPYVSYPSHSVGVGAINFQYPLIVRWDTALFHAAYLPVQQGVVNIATISNDYFFSVNNDPLMSAYNMLLDDSAYAPTFTWFSQSQFPMHFYIAYDPNVLVREFKRKNEVIQVYPNPFSTITSITSKESISLIEIFSIDGRRVYFENFPSQKVLRNHNLLLSYLDPGIYLLLFYNSQKQSFHEKIIKRG